MQKSCVTAEAFQRDTASATSTFFNKKCASTLAGAGKAHDGVWDLLKQRYPIQQAGLVLAWNKSNLIAIVIVDWRRLNECRIRFLLMVLTLRAGSCCPSVGYIWSDTLRVSDVRYRSYHHFCRISSSSCRHTLEVREPVNLAELRVCCHATGPWPLWRHPSTKRKGYI